MIDERHTDTSVEPRTKSSLLLLQASADRDSRRTVQNNYPYHVTDVPLNGTSVIRCREEQKTWTEPAY